MTAPVVEGAAVQLRPDAVPFGGVFGTVVDVHADAVRVSVGGGETTVALVSELQVTP